MPAFTWFNDATIDGSITGKKMEALRMIGVPYTDEDIANAAAAVEGKSEMDAMVAYLQGLGKEMRNR